jgi:hypothetical protein
MSLIEELAQNGITTEDLEKAASLRLFEKVAANNGINLSELDDSQVEELFTDFITNVLPELSEGGEESAESADEGGEEIDAEKAASIFLFQKTAADEGLDLSSMEPEQLNNLYNYFLDEVLPGMIQGEGGEEQAEQPKQASAEEVEEAQAKLAEVEILGRHMARSFNDELDKIAQEDTNSDENAGVSDTQHKKGLSRAKKVGLGGAGLTGAGLLAAGAKTGYDAMKAAAPAAAQAATSAASAPELFDKLAEERAYEILAANGIDPSAEQEPSFDDLLTARAVELLEANGYTFEG